MTNAFMHARAADSLDIPRLIALLRHLMSDRLGRVAKVTKAKAKEEKAKAKAKAKGEAPKMDS